MKTVPDWWEKPRRISIVIDNPSWILPHAQRLAKELNQEGDECVLCREHHEILDGDVAFFLDCRVSATPEILVLNKRNLTYHESDLPKGRGFSAFERRILDGINQIPVCLIEMLADEGAGDIIYRDAMSFEGHELNGEMREIRGVKVTELIKRFLDEPYPIEGEEQSGEETWFPQRLPRDSRLHLNKTIEEQFNLLRVADNYRYPAYFDYMGQVYKINIEKFPGDSPDQILEKAASEQSHKKESTPNSDGESFTEKTKNGDEVHILPVTKEDGRLLFEWQSQETSRRHARNPSKPTKDEHMQWLEDCLNDPNRHLNIIIYNNERAGVLRLDKVGEDCLEVSIMIAPEYYRKGIGAAALRLARKTWPNVILRAEVLPGNEASHALFEKCGYEPLRNQIYLNLPTGD